jgi:hypothetical protein
VKVDFQIEALVKRVERQYHDVESKKSADELKVGRFRERRDGSSSVLSCPNPCRSPPPPQHTTQVAGQPVDRYISNFNWEHAKYPQRRTLPELVRACMIRHQAICRLVGRPVDPVKKRRGS